MMHLGASLQSWGLNVQTTCTWMYVLILHELSISCEVHMFLPMNLQYFIVLQAREAYTVHQDAPLYLLFSRKFTVSDRNVIIWNLFCISVPIKVLYRTYQKPTSVESMFATIYQSMECKSVASCTHVCCCIIGLETRFAMITHTDLTICTRHTLIWCSVPDNLALFEISFIQIIERINNIRVLYRAKRVPGGNLWKCILLIIESIWRKCELMLGGWEVRDFKTVS